MKKFFNFVKLIYILLKNKSFSLGNLLLIYINYKYIQIS